MNSSTQNKPSKKLSALELSVFAMLGTLVFLSKMVTEFLPNIHLVGALTIAYTVVYRKKALFPIYVFVFLTGIYAGFALWWIPYLYLWAILWAVTMLLPKNMSKKTAAIVYPIVCAFHGLCYGTLYAPAQAIMYGLNFDQIIAWIGAGLAWDAVHAVGNFFAGLLIVPTVSLLKKTSKFIK